MVRAVATAIAFLVLGSVALAVDLAETRELAENGDAWYQTELAMMYHYGKHLKRDYTEAARWYRLAAEQGQSKAQANLGVLYAEGKGVQKDYEQAAHWFLKAAEQGSPVAQHNLGLLYGRGNGVDQNYVEAYIWASLAVNSGHTEAIESRDAFKARLSDDQLRTAERRKSFLYLRIEQYKSSQ